MDLLSSLQAHGLIAGLLEIPSNSVEDLHTSCNPLGHRAASSSVAAQKSKLTHSFSSA